MPGASKRGVHLEEIDERVVLVLVVGYEGREPADPIGVIGSNKDQVMRTGRVDEGTSPGV